MGCNLTYSSNSPIVVIFETNQPRSPTSGLAMMGKERPACSKKDCNSVFSSEGFNKTVFGLKASGIFLRIADLDSPKKPPVSIPGLVSVKKKKSLALIAFHIQMNTTGILKTYTGQYSHDLSRMKKRLHQSPNGDEMTTVVF